MLIGGVEVSQHMPRPLGFLAMVMLSTACSAASTDDVSGDPDSRPSSTQSLSLVGKVVDYGARDDIGVGLEGVKVCASQPNLGCSTTGAEGYAFDGLSPNAEFRLSFEKAGYMPSILDLKLGQNSTTEKGALLSVAFIEKLLRSRNAEQPAETGGVLLLAHMLDYDGLLALRGVSFEIEHQTDVLNIYVDDSGQPLEGGTKTGALGWGLALGVRPGKLSGVVFHELVGARCGPLGHAEMELENRFEVEVVSGTISLVNVICVYKG